MRLEVNLELVRKYNVPGPRYTSYPTAAQFTGDFSRERLEADLISGGASPRPLSLYFHLPFCETLCWFCGCTTVIGRGAGRADVYLDYLARELALSRSHIHPESEVIQVHFGGGTPNFLTPEQINRLGALISEHFHLAADAEVSVELDPRRLTREHIAAFRDLGATRASFGIQDFNPVVQKAVNRVQPRELSDQAAAWLRELGYESFNIDLIYGLPHQTVDSFAETVALAQELRPDRFAVFNYAHVPWMRPAQKLLEAAMPAAEAKLGMLKTAIETLTANGFIYIGMDHFARADDELARAQRAGTLQRNFQGYSTRAGADIFGFGMSSISQTPMHYRQNERSLSDYYARIDAGELPVVRACFLTAEDARRREVIIRLMCDLALDFAVLSRRLNLDFREHFAAELEALRAPAADGLVELRGDGLTVTPGGRLFIRNLAMVFDTYLAISENRFSRTI